MRLVVDDERRVHTAIQSKEFERDIAFAVEAAEWAGERVLALRASGRWKETGVLADIGDQAADGLLQGFIRGRYPDDGILSEETADSARRLSKQRVWIVDPLDGTREYSQLREDWAVHIGLIVNGKCALGVVGLPARNKLVWGVCADGANAYGLRGEGRLNTGSSPLPERPRIAVSRSHTPSWMARFADLLGAEMVYSGSVGNKVGMLLLDEADIYAHRKGLNEWDTCAPECVARALGWSVSTLRGTEMSYNQPNPRIDEFLMCKPAWRERVLAALIEAGAVKD
ncbi:MAG: 3'(2'),5'-bisphosphate nucleotidase CysQ [Planctomycetes bacterium]|nr:3'(2'),5'-bisphosphate nucleotidase CysQ [Planctomycetota bacterium]